MAISRRIFKKQYKKPRPRNIYFTNNKIKSEIKSSKTSKFLQGHKKLHKSSLRRSLNIRSWNSLTIENRLGEQVHAQRDIRIFAQHYTPKFKIKSGESVFQAYLPGDVWKKMSKHQRQEHLRKRDDLVKKGVKFFKPQYKKINYKAYFTNAQYRPVLKSMSDLIKINYLKALIARAKMHAFKIHREIDPEISRTAPNKINVPLINQQLLNFRSLTKMRKLSKESQIIGRLTPKKLNRKKHG